MDLETRVIAPDVDGVDIEFRNRTGRTLDLVLADGEGTATFSPGTTRVVTFGVEPGRHRIACGVPGKPRYAGAWVEVRDVANVWRSADPECDEELGGWGIEDGPGPLPGDPLELTRAMAEAIEADAVELAGYPDYESPYARTVRVIKGGEVVAVVSWTRDERSGWWLDSRHGCHIEGFNALRAFDAP